MFSLFLVVSVILVNTPIIIKADDVDKALVNYYLDLIENRTREAENYTFPTDARMYEPRNKTLKEYGEFDYIVIGAGSTGSIIAGRLSEGKRSSVLLLEAGTYPDQDLTRIPALWQVDAQTKFNWGFQSIPQKYVVTGNSNRFNIPRGKGIGGTSLINGMNYARGNRLDYDKWSDSLNDSSWAYENLLPYHRKTENFTRAYPNLPINWCYHGTKGLLHVSQSVPLTELDRATLQGGKILGYNITDHNGKQQMGVSVIQSYLNNGFRDDPGQAFVSSAKIRKNLKVLDKSYVIKLDIDNSTRRINGVIFTRNNETFIVKSRREVILSAGVFGSAQILMLSGIGPEDHLKSVGIPVIQNLPVGETLHEHPFASIPFSHNMTSLNRSAQELIREFLKGRGPLTSVLTFNGIAWFKLPKKQPQDMPDIEIIFVDFGGPLAQNHNPIAAGPTALHSHSKGSLKLKSSDPFEYPLIDPNLLSDEKDLELLYEGVQILLELTKTEPFRKLNVTLALTPVEECNSAEPLSKEFWFCHFKRIVIPGNHYISTCRTGTSPETGVVDKDLKVFGVNGLRVADASIIPFTFANHPTATLAAIAEKISAQIQSEN